MLDPDPFPELGSGFRCPFCTLVKKELRPAKHLQNYHLKFFFLLRTRILNKCNKSLKMPQNIEEELQICILQNTEFRIRGSAPLTNGSGSGSNSGSDLSSVTKDAKKWFFFFIFFLYNLPMHRHIIFSLNFWRKFCVKILLLQALFQKREGSGSGSWRLKNLRIRIPNTGNDNQLFFFYPQCTDCYGDAVMEEGEGGERHCHNKSLLFKVGRFPFFLPTSGIELGFPVGLGMDPIILLSVLPVACKEHCTGTGISLSAALWYNFSKIQNREDHLQWCGSFM